MTFLKFVRIYTLVDSILFNIDLFTQLNFDIYINFPQFMDNIN
jgi:hypothetical protein